MSDNFRASIDRKTNHAWLRSIIHPGKIGHLPRPVSHSASAECCLYCCSAQSVTRAMGGAAGCVCTTYITAVRTHPCPGLHNESKSYVIFAYGRVYL